MALEILVSLADRTYTVKKLPMKGNKRWRKKLEGPFADLAGILGNMDDLELMSDVTQVDAKTGEKVKTGTTVNFTSISGVVGSFSRVLLGSIDLLMDLLFEYSPELAADREYIEENAFDEEALAALVGVLKLAYPFGTVWEMVTGSRLEGQIQRSTGPNSSSPSTGSGTAR